MFRPRPRCLSVLAIVALLALAGTCTAAASSDALTTSSITTGPPEDLPLGCPSPAGAPGGVQVWLHVVRWCALPAVRDQAQFKLQLQIYNKSRYTLGIGLEHLRLIVADFDIAKWSPPRSGQPTTERPFRAIYQGQHVWAIPPNAEDAYDPVPGIPGDLTFATHWGQTQLGPGQVFNPSYHVGDLVFYVPYLPHDGEGIATRNNVLGMAYVHEGDIDVICPKRRWGPKEPAATF